MSANMKVANRYLQKAAEELEAGCTERAAVWAQMAMVPVAADLQIHVRKVAEKIDRLASVVDNGKTWH